VLASSVPVLDLQNLEWRQSMLEEEQAPQLWKSCLLGSLPVVSAVLLVLLSGKPTPTVVSPPLVEPHLLLIQEHTLITRTP
jgi:hypothetical protein